MAGGVDFSRRRFSFDAVVIAANAIAAAMPHLESARALLFQIAIRIMIQCMVNMVKVHGQSATFSHAWQRCEKKYKNRKEQCTQRCTLYTGFVTVLAIYTSEQGGENPGFDPGSKPQILLRFHFPTYIKSSTSASKHPLVDGVSYFRAGNRMFQESGPAHLT